MVCIRCDNDDKRGFIIRDMLLKSLIPTAVGDDPSLLDYALVTVEFMEDDKTDREVFRDAECTVLCDGEAILSPARRKAELFRLIARIEDVLLIKYGFDPYTVVRGHFYDSPDVTRFRGRECPFTLAERMILRFLSVCGEKRATAPTVRAYCLSDTTSPNAVAVHVKRINDRAYIVSPKNVISTRRYEGYRLSYL